MVSRDKLHRTFAFWLALLGTSLLLGQSECQPCTDTDGDGFCLENGDCDDENASVYPDAPELCDNIDNDCDLEVDEGVRSLYYPDRDFDGYGDPAGDPVENCSQPFGYASNVLDCDDTNPEVRPNAIETANGIDDNCNGEVDEGTADEDADGYSVAEGDCDDANPTVYPLAEEICDNMDNDCDGDSDERLGRFYFLDEDGDGFGLEASALCASSPGYADALGDCDDADATVHPGADDLEGDEIDQDCGGTDAPEPHVGYSESSLATIQEAIDAAVAGTTVWVGPGTYLEHGLRFNGKAILLSGTHWADATIIEAERQGRVFTFDAAETVDTILRRVTLTGGLADIGGGVYTSDASPVLDEVIIQSNLATTSGGGFYFEGGAPTLQNSKVLENMADNVYGGGGNIGGGAQATLYNVTLSQNDSKLEGGGLSISSANVTISYCLFSNNYSISSRGGGAHFRNAGGTITDTTFKANASLGASGSSSYGGGLYLDSSTPEVRNCRFISNTATFGAGLYLEKANADFANCLFQSNTAVQRGGAVYLNQSTPTMANVSIQGNVADFGAGMYLFESNPTMFNSLLESNSASSTGGGMYAYQSSPRIFSAIIAKNYAPTGGGLYLYGASTTMHIENSVIAYNSEENIYATGAGADDIPVPEILYTDIYNPEGIDNHNLETLDPTVLEVEPGFLEYGEDGLPTNYHLQLTSPLVDEGLNYVDVDGTPVDLGMFGGSFGNDWNRDFDAVPDYFWAGRISNVPEGFSMTDFDPNDFDPSVP